MVSGPLTHLLAIAAIGCSLAWGAGPPQPSCPKLSLHIDKEKAQLQDLLGRKTELLRMLEGRASELKIPLANLDQAGDDEVRKLLFARRSLDKNVEQKSKAIKISVDSYCEQCKTTTANAFALLSYCDKCPRSLGCPSGYRIPKNEDPVN